MEYKAWIEYIQHNKDSKYYMNLLVYSPQILEELKSYKQHIVAKKLRMSPPKLSLFKPMLEAYNEEVYKTV